MQHLNRQLKPEQIKSSEGSQICKTGPLNTSIELQGKPANTQHMKHIG